MTDKSLSGLTDAGALAEGDVLYIVRGGNSRKADISVSELTTLLGSSFQAADADLTAIAALAKTDGNIIVGNGTTWVAESGSTARASLGVGTADSPQFTGLTLTANLAMPSGGVISFNSGDVTVTHSSNTLAFGGASSGYTFDATITVSSSAFANNGVPALFLESTDAGASQSPVIVLYRNSASPAASDFGGSLEAHFKDGNGTKISGVKWETTITTVTAGSVSAQVDFTTRQAGTLAPRLRIAAGLYHTSATGGDKGDNTINFGAVYDDNVLLTDYVFDRFMGIDGSYSPRVQAAADALDPAMFDPQAYAAFFRANRRLWGMPDLNDCMDGLVKEKSLGAMIQLLWQTVELQAIHVEHLLRRVRALEAAGKSQ